VQVATLNKVQSCGFGCYAMRHFAFWLPVYHRFSRYCVSLWTRATAAWHGSWR